MLGVESKMNLNEFLKLGEEDAVKYDFLNESVNADNSVLIRQIYTELFPWYRDMPRKYSGDTMNTYKRAIWYKEKESNNRGHHHFVTLSESKQERYLEIIEKNTKTLDTHCFGTKTYGLNGNVEKLIKTELCNNHQLGNFWVLPLEKASNGTMNTLKNTECNDYMDLALKKIKDFLRENNVRKESGFIGALSNSTHYLSYFDNQFKTFIEKNYLDDYIKGTEIVDLESLSFEQYVETSNKIIESRGRTMFRRLLN